MSDQAAIMLRVDVDHHNMVNMLTNECELRWDMITIDDDHADFENWDARWGASSLTEPDSWGTKEPALTQLLRDRGISYRIIDYGHYTWDAYELGWEAGMSTEASRSVTGDAGAVLLTEYEYQRLVEASGSTILVLQRIDGHFSDDPTKWLNQQSLLDNHQAV